MFTVILAYLETKSVNFSFGYVYAWTGLIDLSLIWGTVLILID